MSICKFHCEKKVHSGNDLKKKKNEERKDGKQL